MIPSVQVGAGIPLQSTQMSMAQSALPQQSVAQSAVQQNMAPVQAGSILQLPPGSMVPVQAGNSIVYVPTQPIATQQVSAQPQVQYQTQTYQAPVETQKHFNQELSEMNYLHNINELYFLPKSLLLDYLQLDHHQLPN